MKTKEMINENFSGKFQGMEKKPSVRVLFIVPAFNEEGNIAKTIGELKGLPLNSQIIVINDGSMDKTSLKAKEAGALIIDLPFNLGIGGAVQTGFKYAKENGFDIAVQVDGDGQHDVDYVAQLIEPIVNNRADMTIGSRFLPPFIGYRSSFVRRIGIHFFAYLISFLTKYSTTDPTSGFRAYNRKMIRVFDRYYPHDFPEPEAIVVAGRYKAAMLEVPVKMRKRESGKSSIRYLNTLYYMIKVTFAILLDKIKSRKNMPDD